MSSPAACRAATALPMSEAILLSSPMGLATDAIIELFRSMRPAKLGTEVLSLQPWASAARTNHVLLCTSVVQSSTNYAYCYIWKPSHSAARQGTRYDLIDGSGSSSTSKQHRMDPYALAADGSAKDPRAFQKALRQDAEKMAQLEKVCVDASLNSQCWPARQALQL
jgi:hypothetical protein